MRKREREKVVAKIGQGSSQKHGQSVHVRPYYSDEKKLEEIARETGEGKAEIVRRMIRFALSDKQERFGANRCRERLDWLIEKERQIGNDSDAADGRLDEILKRVERLEADHKAASHNTPLLLRELYMMSSVSVSTLNILLSKLLELSTSGGADKDKGVRIADGIMVKLIANAISDLEKCSAFHGLDPDLENPSDLYLATKIKILKENVAETPESEPRYK
ncbi:MAG: hypothetical protein KF762_07110 [Acidobacteria bacterium]|nr:hypothetical protein [Acidobacteriota bacterium]